MSPSPDPRRIDALDAVRGVAALIVLFSHCMVAFPAFCAVYYHPEAPAEAWVRAIAFSPLHLLWGGHEEVLLFFVLSGFVLSLPYLEGRASSYGAFLVRRICRIYLPYLAVCVVAAGLMTMLAGPPLPVDSEWFARNWTHPVTWATVVDHLLMLGDPGENFINMPIWSLVHEMRISLLFPLLMLVVVPLRGWKLATLTIGLYMLGGWTQRDPWMQAHFPLTLALSLQFVAFFAAGASLARHRTAIVAWLEARGRWTVSALAVFALACFNVRWEVPGVRGQEFIIGLGACILIMLALGVPRLRAFLETAPMRWLGRISYSLYLTHLVVLLTMAYTLGRWLPMPLVTALVPFVSLLVAHLSHRVLEVPTIALGRWLTTRSTSRHEPPTERVRSIH